MIVRPKVSEMDGVATPSRMQGVQVFQGQLVTLEWTMRDQDGNPVDLSDVLNEQPSASSGSSIQPLDTTIELNIMECLSVGTQCVPLTLSGEIIDEAKGTVKVDLTPEAVSYAGVFYLEWRLKRPDGHAVLVNQGYMLVNRSITSQQATAPPTIQELRLSIRDSGPEDNYLLDRIEYDLAEVAIAMVQAVRTWNETMSFVNVRYNTTTFPYQRQWMFAIVGELFLLAADNYDRNLQEYSAGGTSMRDKDKGPKYREKGVELLQSYKSFVTQRKAQLNLEQGYGHTEIYGGW